MEWILYSSGTGFLSALWNVGGCHISGVLIVHKCKEIRDQINCPQYHFSGVFVRWGSTVYDFECIHLQLQTTQVALTTVKHLQQLSHQCVCPNVRTFTKLSSFLL